MHPAPATRPALELADILRQCAGTYRQTHRLSVQQQRVVNALVSCRTAALGGFKACCDHCGAVTIQYASCRNRHCPKCQTLAQTRWVERQCAELLDIGYWHVVFTLPHELNPIAQGNPALIYRLLFNAASKSLLEFGRNPRWLGGELGITMVLHTWGQNLGQHIHVHCIVTDGALSPDRQRWITPVRRGFLFPTAALSKVFRGKYLDFLTTAHRNGELRMPGADGLDDTCAFECLKTSLQSNDWVVYSKAPFAGASQCSRLPRALHSQDRHRQSSTRRLRWRACSLPMARLRSRQQAQGDASRRGRVRPPLPSSCAPAPIHAAAPLRRARQSRARSQARLVPNAAATARPRTARAGNAPGDDAASDRDRHHRVSGLWAWDAAAHSHSRIPAPHREASGADSTTMTTHHNR